MLKIYYLPFFFYLQECKMKFGSWTYDGFKLDVTFFEGQEQIDLNDYIPSNEWDVLSHQAKKNVKYYPCCREPYPDLTFTLKLKRKVAFYNYILILPCVLLSSLTLVLFWLPPESPAKMVLGQLPNHLFCNRMSSCDFTQITSSHTVFAFGVCFRDEYFCGLLCVITASSRVNTTCCLFHSSHW